MTQAMEIAGWVPEVAALPIVALGGEPIGAKAEDATLALSLKVVDPEVVADLRGHAEGETRNQYALGALRIGILAFRAAAGQIDTSQIRHAGDKLMSDMSSLLNERSRELTAQVTGTIEQYFDPKTGLLQQRLQSLVQNDGELERLLRTP